MRTARPCTRVDQRRVEMLCASQAQRFVCIWGLHHHMPAPFQEESDSKA